MDSWNSPSSSFYGFDSQGSTPILTNPAGAVTDAYAYLAFGTAWQGGNGSTNAYRYVGEYGYYRDSTAVQYVRARWLAVGTDRWLSEDPIHVVRNLYLYAQVMPQVLNDPIGKIATIRAACSGNPDVDQGSFCCSQIH